MIGRIIFSTVHRGTLFTSSNTTYVLLDGQSISRDDYPSLSAVWPSGQFGGGDVTEAMHLPDIDGLNLRGTDFGRGLDPDASSRTAISGHSPTGDRCGSLQAAGLKTHAHISGSQNVPHPNNRVGGGGEGPRSTSPSSSNVDGDAIIGLHTTRPIHFNKADTLFEVDCGNYFMYIAVND